MKPSPAGAAANPLPGWKRALDLAAVAAVLPLLGVCALGLAVLIRATSPGPLFYRQERIGRRGRPFFLLKFRTMHHGAETASHRSHVASLIHTNRPMQKLDGESDPRLLCGGWLLRASGLDELPQVLNVLRGEMSLVGPRPCLPFEFRLYDERQRERFDAMPGLTGLWQVSGKNRTTFQRMVELDIAYARQLSPGQDLRIIALTVPVLIRQIAETAHRRRGTAVPTEAGLPAASRSAGAGLPRFLATPFKSSARNGRLPPPYLPAP